jgi:hypothetical protein
MLKRLAEGECVGITPDGPRGPATVASGGIVNLARLAGAPIVPIACATSRRKILNSWDRFNLPLPFGRGVFVWGEPIEIASDLDAAGIEQARRFVECRMNELAREADRRVGHDVAAHGAAPFGMPGWQEPRFEEPPCFDESSGRGSRPLSGSVSDRPLVAAEENLPAGERQRS